MVTAKRKNDVLIPLWDILENAGRRASALLVHLVNGQRLYYILIRALQDVRKVVKLIQDEISLRPPFEAHSCAYVVFGEVDIIIRACVADTDLKPFLDRLNQLDLEIDNVVLVNNSHTWYQHRIEESRKFKTYFQTRVDANQLLHRQEIPEWLKFEDRRKPRIKASSRKKKTDAEPQGPIKYFVFAHETKGSIDPLYDALRKELYESSSSEQRISLHKITSQKYESGVLIEGETVDKKTRDPEDAVYALTDRIKALGVYRTTTYVRAKGHVDKHDLYLPEQPVSNRKRVNTRNAVLSETKQLLTDEVEAKQYSYRRPGTGLPELPRRDHVSQARISQIMSLLQLAPDLQEDILFWPPIPTDATRSRWPNCYAIAALRDWQAQRRR